MSDWIEVILTFVIIGIFGIFLVNAVEEEPEVVFEYETMSGETGEATFCTTYKNTYCTFEDGTHVVNIKTYKRVEK